MTGSSRALSSSSPLLTCPGLIHLKTMGNESALVSRFMPFGPESNIPNKNRASSTPEKPSCVPWMPTQNTKQQKPARKKSNHQPSECQRKTGDKVGSLEVRIHFFKVSDVEKEIGSVVIAYTYTSRKCQRGRGRRIMRKKLRHERPRFPAQL